VSLLRVDVDTLSYLTKPSYVVGEHGCWQGARHVKSEE